MATSTIARPADKAVTPAPSHAALGLMRTISDDIEAFFNDAGFGIGRWPIGARIFERSHAVWMPSVEVQEQEGRLVVRADLPGMTREQISVALTENLLTIEGERQASSREKVDDYFRTERSYGHFSRAIALPKTVKSDTAVATFSNGVLEVTFEIVAPTVPAARQLPITEPTR